MDKPFSLYLDLARFTAAILVVLSHFVQQGIIGHAAPGTHAPLLNFGREAVIVFFVLSGFVIAFTTASSHASARDYVVARCARIYSVAAPVVLGAFLLAVICTRWTGLEPPNAYQLQKPQLYLPLHLLFMGELWHLVETPPWLLQYWSLGYEVWYYVLFGLAFYLRGTRRALALTLVLLVMGPKLWLLLPVWLAGVALFRWGCNRELGPRQAGIGVLATILALGLYKAAGADLFLRELGIRLWPFPAFRLGSADRYLADYVVCILVCIHFQCARYAGFSHLYLAAVPIRALASYTFTLYLVHGPVMGMWQLFYRSHGARALDALLLALCIGAATYACGYVTERRRQRFKQLFNYLYLHTARRFA